MNLYHFNSSSGRSIYLPPVLNEIVKLRGEIKNTEIKASRKDIKYYFNKYNLLKHNGYFDENVQLKNVNYPINSFQESIKECRQIIFEVTEACNLKCTYCGYGDYYLYNRNHSKKTLSVDWAKKLIEFFVQQWNIERNNNLSKNIRIGFYGGEPLLNFDFITEIIEYSKKIKLKYNTFSYGITTNGVLLNKYMDFLVEHNFFLGISLDGDEYNSSHRVFKNGQSSYMTIKKNIDVLKKKKPDFFKSNVNFISVLHNCNSAEDIYNYFKKFDKKSQIQILSRNGLKKSMLKNFDKIYTKFDKNITKNKIASILKNDPYFKFPLGERVRSFLYQKQSEFYKKKDLIRNDAIERINTTGTCIPLSTKVYLSASGNIYPCESTFFINPIGQVSDQGVKIDFTEVNQKINSYFYRLYKQCKSCAYATNCPVCVFLIELEKNNYKCSNFKTVAEYKNDLSDIMDHLENNPSTYQKFADEFYILN